MTHRSQSAAALRRPPAARLGHHHHARHSQAVRRTLGWADEAAHRGEYGEAVAWLETVTAIGDPLPPAYRSKHRAWVAALGVAGREQRAAS